MHITNWFFGITLKQEVPGFRNICWWKEKFVSKTSFLCELDGMLWIKIAARLFTVLLNGKVMQTKQSACEEKINKTHSHYFQERKEENFRGVKEFHTLSIYLCSDLVSCMFDFIYSRSKISILKSRRMKMTSQNEVQFSLFPLSDFSCFQFCLFQLIMLRLLLLYCLFILSPLLS